MQLRCKKWRTNSRDWSSRRCSSEWSWNCWSKRGIAINCFWPLNSGRSVDSLTIWATVPRTCTPIKASEIEWSQSLLLSKAEKWTKSPQRPLRSHKKPRKSPLCIKVFREEKTWRIFTIGSRFKSSRPSCSWAILPKRTKRKTPRKAVREISLLEKERQFFAQNFFAKKEGSN